MYADPTGHPFCIGWGQPSREVLAAFVKERLGQDTLRSTKGVRPALGCVTRERPQRPTSTDAELQVTITSVGRSVVLTA